MASFISCLIDMGPERLRTMIGVCHRPVAEIPRLWAQGDARRLHQRRDCSCMSPHHQLSADSGSTPCTAQCPVSNDPSAIQTAEQRVSEETVQHEGGTWAVTVRFKPGVKIDGRTLLDGFACHLLRLIGGRWFKPGRIRQGGG